MSVKFQARAPIFWNAFMERKIDQRSVIISPRHFRLSYRYVYFLGKPRSFKRDFLPASTFWPPRHTIWRTMRSPDDQYYNLEDTPTKHYYRLLIISRYQHRINARHSKVSCHKIGMQLLRRGMQLLRCFYGIYSHTILKYRMISKSNWAKTYVSIFEVISRNLNLLVQQYLQGAV